MSTTRHSDTCLIKQANSGKELTGEIMSFDEKNLLIVALNKSVKLNMVWNGRMYEGKAAGMDFVSDGPKIIKIVTGLRG